MIRRLAILVAGALGASLLAAVPGRAADAICYNCPPEWADWATMLKSIKADIGLTMPSDNKNSGQAVAQIIAEKASPIADMAYVGVNFGIAAKAQGLSQPYRPAKFDEIAPGLKDPEGYWWTVHQGTLGLFVNKDALGGKPVPACWRDLLKPEYKGLIGYLDPSSAAVGYVGAVAVNQALGGTPDDMSPALGFFKSLAKNEPIVPKQTSYARTVSGEIPILFDYDFNAYRAKYTEQGAVRIRHPLRGNGHLPLRDDARGGRSAP